MRLAWLLILLGMPALAASPWEGEWEATESPTERYGVSIEGCDAEGKCWVETFQFDTAGRPICSSRARSEKSFDANTLRVGLDQGRCVLTFLRVSDAETTPVITLQAGEKALTCDTMCNTPPIGKPRPYPRLSQRPFHADARETEVCHWPLSKAARFWCASENVGQWENQAIAASGAAGDQTDKWRVEMKTTWLKVTLKACEKSRSIRQCVHDSYVKMGKTLRARTKSRAKK